MQEGLEKQQYCCSLQKKTELDKILYIPLDDLFFTTTSLYSLAENFNKSGGQLLLLDEVHKYPNWTRELKLIYDDFPDLKVIFTSSSQLDIYKGESDLSRCAVIPFWVKNYSLKKWWFFTIFNKENVRIAVVIGIFYFEEESKKVRFLWVVFSLRWYNSFLVKDDVELGINNSIPLWLFGFLY